MGFHHKAKVAISSLDLINQMRQNDQPEWGVFIYYIHIHIYIYNRKDYCTQVTNESWTTVDFFSFRLSMHLVHVDRHLFWSSHKLMSLCHMPLGPRFSGRPCHAILLPHGCLSKASGCSGLSDTSADLSWPGAGTSWKRYEHISFVDDDCWCTPDKNHPFLGFDMFLLCKTASISRETGPKVITHRTLPKFIADRGGVALRPGDGIIHSWLNRMLLPDEVGTGRGFLSVLWFLWATLWYNQTWQWEIPDIKRDYQGTISISPTKKYTVIGCFCIGLCGFEWLVYCIPPRAEKMDWYTRISWNLGANYPPSPSLPSPRTHLALDELPIFCSAEKRRFVAWTLIFTGQSDFCWQKYPETLQKTRFLIQHDS